MNTSQKFQAIALIITALSGSSSVMANGASQIIKVTGKTQKKNIKSAQNNFEVENNRLKQEISKYQNESDVCAKALNDLANATKDYESKTTEALKAIGTATVKYKEEMASYQSSKTDLLGRGNNKLIDASNEFFKIVSTNLNKIADAKKALNDQILRLSSVE